MSTFIRHLFVSEMEDDSLIYEKIAWGKKVVNQ